MTSAYSLVAGTWEPGTVGADSFQRTPPHDPDGELFVVPNASSEQVHRTVAAARMAQTKWLAMSIVERSDAIAAAAALLRQEAGALAELMVSEVGKTLPEALGEIGNAARLFDFHAGSVLRGRGAAIDSGRTRTRVTVEWEPLGVIAAVTPWNFPVNLTAVKLAPALAAGNGFVLKPSPEAAYTSAEFIRLMASCFPLGLIGLVQGDGAVGQALIEDDGIHGVTFTGSTVVGRKVSAAAAARGLPFQCEMGGKNSIAIMESADLDMAVPAVAGSAFRMAGQKCTAAGSVIVHESIYDEVVARLKAQLDSEVFALGDPRDAATVVGPLIGADAAAMVLNQVKAAVTDGATLAWPEGGDLAVPGLPAAYLRPALLTGVTTEMNISSIEVFGPVLTVIAVRDVIEAARAVNVGGYGLVSAIFTGDLSEAMTFSAEVEAGTVLVNQPTTGLDFHVPFGGWGLSGQGPTEQSDDALRVYMRPKTRYLSWAEPVVG